MKTHAWLLAGLLVTGSALADEMSPASDNGFAVDAVADPAADVTLPTDKGRFWAFSYTVGYTLGARLHGELAELDLAAFQDALRESFAGTAPQLSEAQMRLATQQFGEYRQALEQEAQAKIAADNLEKSTAFLLQNGKRKGVKTTRSGLQYEVIKKGSGPVPKPTDIVTAHYHGTLPDGTVFDSSRESDPVDFPLNHVIPGWVEGVQLMNKGAKYKLYVSPALAYGARGIDQAIGPNQALIFEIELIDFKPAEQPQAAAPEAAPEAAPAP